MKFFAAIVGLFIAACSGHADDRQIVVTLRTPADAGRIDRYVIEAYGGKLTDGQGGMRMYRLPWTADPERAVDELKADPAVLSAGLVMTVRPNGG